MSKSKVFVTKFQSNWEYGAAASFGDVVFLTEKEHRPEPVPAEFNERVTAGVEAKLQDYIAGIDYLAFTGSYILNAVAFAIIAKHEGPHKVLKYHPARQEYELFIIRGARK